MSAKPRSPGPIGTVAELYSHALALEEEAAERYADLAEQMLIANNIEVANLFRKMAEIEGKHVGRIRELCAGVSVPRLRAWDYCWDDGESPEAPSAEDTHYLMSARDAVGLALRCEQRAVSFYARMTKETPSREVRAIAAQFHAEEIEHVRLLENLLSRLPERPGAWAEDPDPPVGQG